MRFPRASINFWLTTKVGGRLVQNAKQAREFMHEVEQWSDTEFVKATIEGDFGSKEVTTKDELLKILWDYAVGPPIK